MWSVGLIEIRTFLHIIPGPHDTDNYGCVLSLSPEPSLSMVTCRESSSKLKVCWIALCYSPKELMWSYIWPQITSTYTFSHFYRQWSDEALHNHSDGMELCYVKGRVRHNFFSLQQSETLLRTSKSSITGPWFCFLPLILWGRSDLQPRSCNAAQSKMFSLMTVGPAANLAAGFPVLAVGRQNETGTRKVFFALLKFRLFSHILLDWWWKLSRWSQKQLFVLAACSETLRQKPQNRPAWCSRLRSSARTL